MNHSTEPPSPNFKSLENNALEQAATTGGGGVFRLEAMAPGVENAEAAMAAPRKRKVSTQAIALGILLAVGGGMIYGMRLLGIGPLTTLGVTKVPEYDISRPNAHAQDHKQILKDLALDQAAGQVPVSEVQKNPFLLSDVVGPPPAAGTPSTGDPNAASRAASERARQEAEKRQQHIHQVLSQLKVNGILDGSSPVARISGDAVRIGDTVGEIFTVKAIKGRSVELECDGEAYELHMDDEDLNSIHPKKK
ncbi:MAG TPA: hypothetical protein VHC70_03500 [Phycisphaerales bacterium]|nr:hypothetical protein [Phycisphaerales bacterium]